jgi:DNA invertase Pin-like site-specific DNA recombinase
MKYGYARVSSKSQDYQAQVEALKAAGCKQIYSEKVSAKNTDDRPQFKKLMHAVSKGDTVMVARLDRLARSSRDLHNILHDLEQKGCGFVSLEEGWCDTTTDVGRLITTIMSGIAQFERSLILKRCEEGRKRAKSLGVHLGRPRKLAQHQIQEVRRLQGEGRSNAAIARLVGVSHQTIGRL